MCFFYFSEKKQKCCVKTCDKSITFDFPFDPDILRICLFSMLKCAVFFICSESITIIGLFKYALHTTQGKIISMQFNN